VGEIAAGFYDQDREKWLAFVKNHFP